MIKKVVMAQLWLLEKAVKLLLSLALLAAFYSVLFAAVMHGWSYTGWDRPSLDSFDPFQRAAAAKAAAEKYGGAK